MRITHLGHACLLVEVADARILVDPGGWSPQAHEQRDLDAVLVTHQHPDHVDRGAPARPAARQPRAPASSPTPRRPRSCARTGVDAQPFGPGDEATVGAATVTGVGELHALIHDELPRVHNTGMRITAEGEPVLFHPGDALDAEPGEVDVLAFPLNAPWQRSREMTAFLRRLAAPHAVPVHDALLSEAGRTLYLGQARSLGSSQTQVHDLAGAGPTEFTATS